MKNLLLLFVVLFAQISIGNAQIISGKTVKQKAKDKATQRAENKSDNAIDKGLDKIEEGIGGLFKKKKKKDKNAETDKESASENTPDEETEEKTKVSSAPKGFSAYGKFDFISGEKIIAYDEFENDAVGDFPVKWNTNASGEIVTIDGSTQKWLKLPKEGVVFPEYINELPENFTMEFDVVSVEDFSEMSNGLKVHFPKITDQPRTMFDYHFNMDAQIGFDLHPLSQKGSGKIWVLDNNYNEISKNTTDISFAAGTPAHVSIWRQKSRLRVYVNEQKVWDLPKAFLENTKYTFLFSSYFFVDGMFISNLKLASGLPDTRSRLITEGKFSTTGILFDFQKSNIKSESYGIIKQIADVLKENPTVNVKIVGHTSNDGDANANITLSKQRADAVKQILIKEFSISESRLTTDGKGGSEPADKGTTAEAKANNRRVEFIKL